MLINSDCEETSGLLSCMIQEPHGQSKERHSRSLLLSYAKRHRRVLTLLGTCILFFTFIFRDVLREDARGKKDTYDAAETSFSILDGLIGINDRIRHLEVVIEGHLSITRDAQHWMTQAP